MPAIFGDPTKASAEAGAAFIAATVDALEETFENLQGSYQERNSSWIAAGPGSEPPGHP